MKTYEINSIFRSVQGEGPHVGFPAVFVRFAGCNLSCEFCDTDFSLHQILSVAGILQAVRTLISYEEREEFRVILTGGEPLMQVDSDLVGALFSGLFSVHMETSGFCNNVDLDAVGLCDEVVVSPKDFVRLNLDVIARATTLKLLAPVYFTLDELERMLFSLGSWNRDKTSLVVQPITPRGAERFSQLTENSKEAIRFSEERKIFGEEWRVIPQTHVMMGIK